MIMVGITFLWWLRRFLYLSECSIMRIFLVVAWRFVADYGI